MKVEGEDHCSSRREPRFVFFICCILRGCSRRAITKHALVCKTVLAAKARQPIWMPTQPPGQTQPGENERLPPREAKNAASSSRRAVGCACAPGGLRSVPAPAHSSGPKPAGDSLGAGKNWRRVTACPPPAFSPPKRRRGGLALGRGTWGSARSSLVPGCLLRLSRPQAGGGAGRSGPAGDSGRTDPPGIIGDEPDRSLLSGARRLLIG